METKAGFIAPIYFENKTKKDVSLVSPLFRLVGGWRGLEAATAAQDFGDARSPACRERECVCERDREEEGV